MAILKKDSDNRGNADTGRRSFMWKVGAGMSAVLAAAVPSIAKPVMGKDRNSKSDMNILSKKVAVLEVEKSVRNLHRTFEDMLDKGMYSEAAELFTDNAQVIFNGGCFKGKSGVRRLFCESFRTGQTGKRIEPAPGFELSAEQQQDTLEIAHDQKSAKAGFNYSIQVGAPMEPDSTFVHMARLQGEGIRMWWEGGVYEMSCIKDIRDGIWKIKRLEYKTLSRADFKSGRSYAKPISVPRFSRVYPKDPAGPDRLV